MSIDYIVYYSLPSGLPPNTQHTFDFLKKYEFEFSPLGYMYSFEDDHLTDIESDVTPAEIADIHIANRTDRLDLLQVWKGEHGSRFNFGYFSTPEKNFAAITVSGHAIERLKSHLHDRNIDFCIFLYGIYLSLGADLALGVQEGVEFTNISSISKDKKISEKYTSISLRLIMGCKKQDICEKTANEFTSLLMDGEPIFLKWPFENKKSAA